MAKRFDLDTEDEFGEDPLSGFSLAPDSTDEDTGLEFDDSEKTADEINSESDKLLNSLQSDAPERVQQDQILSSRAPAQQEMSDDDELDLAEPEPEPLVSPEVSKYKGFLNEYKRLQDQRRKGDLVTGLIAASGKIGQSIAGRHSGKFDPDMSGIQMLQKMDERPVHDFEQRQEVQGKGLKLQSDMAAHDPASPQSRMVREYVKTKLGMPLADDVSAADAQMLLKTIGKPNQQKAGQVVRTFNQETGQVELKVFDPTSMSLKPLGETAGFALQPRVDPRTDELMFANPATGRKQGDLTGPTPVPKSGPKATMQSITRENLTAGQQKRLDDYRKEFLTDSKDDRAAVNAAQGIKMTIASGKEIGGDILREIQNQLARGSGEKGAMTDRDVAPFGGRQDILSRIQRAAQMSAEGQLPEEDRVFLTKIAEVMEQRAKNYVANKSDFYVNNMYQDLKSSPNLKNANFNASSIRNLIGVDSAVNPTGNKPSKQIVKKGYNAQTNKTQFIYDDGSKEIVDGKQ